MEVFCFLKTVKRFLKAAIIPLVLLNLHTAWGVNYTWKNNITEGEWSNPDNWTPDSDSGKSPEDDFPNTTSDTAIFTGEAKIKVIFDLSESIDLAGITFNSNRDPTVGRDTDFPGTITGGNNEINLVMENKDVVLFGDRIILVAMNSSPTSGNVKLSGPGILRTNAFDFPDSNEHNFYIDENANLEITATLWADSKSGGQLFFKGDGYLYLPIGGANVNWGVSRVTYQIKTTNRKPYTKEENKESYICTTVIPSDTPNNATAHFRKRNTDGDQDIIFPYTVEIIGSGTYKLGGTTLTNEDSPYTGRAKTSGDTTTSTIKIPRGSSTAEYTLTCTDISENSGDGITIIFYSPDGYNPNDSFMEIGRISWHYQRPTWIGGTDGNDWANPANWNYPGITSFDPTNLDYDIVISTNDKTKYPQIKSDINVKSLTVSVGSHIEHTAGTLKTNAITTAGTGSFTSTGGAVFLKSDAGVQPSITEGFAGYVSIKNLYLDENAIFSSNYAFSVTNLILSEGSGVDDTHATSAENLLIKGNVSLSPAISAKNIYIESGIAGITEDISAENIIAYGGTIDIQNAATLSAQKDFIILGSNYNSSDLNYEHFAARPDGWIETSIPFSDLRKLPYGDDITSFGASLNAETGTTIQAGAGGKGNFYANGTTLQGSGTWYISIPKNDKSENFCAEVVNCTISDCTVKCSDGSSDGTKAQIPVEDCNLASCSNFDSDAFEITYAKTIADNCIYVEVNHKDSSRPMRKNLLNATTAGVITVSDGNGFSSISGSEDGHAEVSDEPKAFFIFTENTSWNTDATGTSVGSGNYTDSSGNDRDVIPYLVVPRFIENGGAVTCGYVITDKWGKRLDNYSPDANAYTGVQDGIEPSLTWTGTVDEKWEDTANWKFLKRKASFEETLAESNITIKNTANNPVISTGNWNVKSLKIEDTGKLSLTGGKLSLPKLEISDDGSFEASGGVLELKKDGTTEPSITAASDKVIFNPGSTLSIAENAAFEMPFDMNIPMLVLNSGSGFSKNSKNLSIGWLMVTTANYSGSGSSITLTEDFTADSIILLLRDGDINVQKNLTANKDIIIGGAGYNSSPLKYEHFITRPAGWVGAFTSTSLEIPSGDPQSESSTLNINSGIELTAGAGGQGNFYANGAKITGTGEWFITIPQNDDPAAFCAEAVNCEITNCTVKCADGSTDGTKAQIPAEECTFTDCSNFDSSEFTITKAYTVADNRIFVEFDGGSESAAARTVRNTNGELSETLAGIITTSDDSAFSAFYSTEEGTEAPAAEPHSFYLYTSNTTWNLDATGTSAGSGKYTDASGNARDVIPYLTIPNMIIASDGSVTCGYTITDKWGKRIKNYSPADTSACTTTEDGISKTFSWTGLGTDANWTSYANWKGDRHSTGYPGKIINCNAVLDAETSTITLDEDITIDNFYIDSQTVSITSESKTLTVSKSMITGTSNEAGTSSNEYKPAVTISTSSTEALDVIKAESFRFLNKESRITIGEKAVLDISNEYRGDSVLGSSDSGGTLTFDGSGTLRMPKSGANLDNGPCKVTYDTTQNLAIETTGELSYYKATAVKSANIPYSADESKVEVTRGENAPAAVEYPYKVTKLVSSGGAEFRLNSVLLSEGYEGSITISSGTAEDFYFEYSGTVNEGDGFTIEIYTPDEILSSPKTKKLIEITRYKDRTTWTGKVSSDWSDPENWELSNLSKTLKENLEESDLFIRQTANSPEISSDDWIVKSITIEKDAKLTMKGGSLSIPENLTLTENSIYTMESSTLTAQEIYVKDTAVFSAPDGTVKLNGDAAKIEFSSTEPVELKNLELTSGTDLTLESNAEVTNLTLNDDVTIAATGTHALKTSNLIITAGSGSLELNDSYSAENIYISSGTADVTQNIESQNIFFYGGKLNIAADKEVSAQKDFIILGPQYAASSFKYEHFTKRPAGWAAAGLSLSDLGKLPDETVISDFSAEVNADAGASLKAGAGGQGNFYANGANLNGTGEWFITIPQNDSPASFCAEAVNCEITNCTVKCTDGSADGTKAQIPAEECTFTDCSNFDSADFEITKAYTVADNRIFVEFDGGSESAAARTVRNTNGELSETLAGIITTSDDSAFSAFYSTETGTEPPAATPNSIYLYTENTNWNTDATGTSTGAEESTNKAGIHRTVFPELKIPQMLIASDGSISCGYTITDKWGKRIKDYQTTAFSNVEDKTPPVLTKVYTGQELHTEYSGNESSQPPYDAHNFIEFQYSEPVNFGSTMPLSEKSAAANQNFRTSESFGGITVTASKMTIAGLAELTGSSYSLSCGIKGSATKDNNTPHALYRFFKTTADGQSEYQTHRIRLGIAAWVNGTANLNGTTFKNWAGYISSAKTPAGTASQKNQENALFCITDEAGNILKENAATTAVSNTESELYGLWDVSAPCFAPYRPNSETPWAGSLSEENAEAIGTNSGSARTLDRIEFHIFDNTPAYSSSDIVEWYTGTGWVTYGSENSKANLYNAATEDFFSCADRTGGARATAEISRRTLGGIRSSSLAGSTAAFKYIAEEDAEPTSSFSGEPLTKVASGIFTGSALPMQSPSENDSLYFGLKFTEKNIPISTTFTVSYDSESGYITDLAGNLLQNAKINTIQRRPPLFEAVLSPISGDKLLIAFSSEIVTSSAKISYFDNATGSPVTISEKLENLLPGCFELISIDSSGNAVKSQDVQIDSNTAAKITADGKSLPYITLNLTKAVSLTDVKNLYVRLIQHPDYDELSRDPLSGISGCRVTFIQDSDAKHEQSGKNFMPVNTAHTISDFALGAINPLYAYTSPDSESGEEIDTDIYTARDFTKSQKNYGTLQYGQEITLVAKPAESITESELPENVKLYISDTPDSDSLFRQFNIDFNRSVTAWLPEIPGIDLFAYTSEFNKRFWSSDSSFLNQQKPLDGYKFIFSKNKVKELKTGSQTSFLFEFLDSNKESVKHYITPYYNVMSDTYDLSKSSSAPLFALTLTNPQDLLSLDLWYLKLKSITEQRGGVTILNNVINASNSEKTVLKVNMASSGNLEIMVMTLDGNIIKYLAHGSAGAGEHYYYWDGKNNAGSPVARGMYFVIIKAPGIDETRKVMVVR